MVLNFNVCRFLICTGKLA